jgi:hypothetical protein
MPLSLPRKEEGRRCFQHPGLGRERNLSRNNNRNSVGKCLKSVGLSIFRFRFVPSAERPIPAVARERRGWRCRRGDAWLAVRARGNTCCRTFVAQARGRDDGGRLRSPCDRPETVPRSVHELLLVGSKRGSFRKSNNLTKAHDVARK